MNRLTIEFDYDAGAFANHSDAICTMRVRREDGSLLYEERQQQLLFSGTVEALRVMLTHMAAAAHGPIF